MTWAEVEEKYSMEGRQGLGAPCTADGELTFIPPTKQEEKSI
jgi:hypothetical protein